MTTTQQPSTSLADVAGQQLAAAVAEATAFLEAGQQLSDTDERLVWYTDPQHGDRPLTRTTLRALAATPGWLPTITLLDAAALAEGQGRDQVAQWLREYAAGCRCGDAGACVACGTVVCETCNLGEPSNCRHPEVEGPLCIGCDVEYCRECALDFITEVNDMWAR